MKTEQIIEKVRAIDGLGAWMSGRLAAYLRSADDETYSTFFSSYNRIMLPAAYAEDIRRFSRLYISRVISEVSEHNLCNMVVSKTQLEKELADWFSEKNRTLGELLAAERLREELPEVFANPRAHAAGLADTLTAQSFINGMEVDCSVNPLRQQPLRLLWLLMKQLDSNLFRRLEQAWPQTVYTSVADTSWMDLAKAGMAGNTDIFRQVQEDIRKACEKKTEISREHMSRPVGQSSMGIPIYENRTYVRCQKGVEVSRWIKQKSGYASGADGDFEIEGGSGGSGCVLCGTKLLTDTGFTAIEKLTEGTKVISEKRMPSVYSGEMVHNSDVMQLYAVNDDEPFMSFDHMILTADGYKCLAPETALKLNPGISVSRLKVNDVVIKYRMDKNGQLCEEREKVRRINTAANTLPCADIHISDGYKSYITENGYVCCANYPEVTAKSINESLARSKNYYADHDFRRVFREHQRALADAFGEAGVNYVGEMMNRQSAKGSMPLVSFKCPDFLLRSLDFVDIPVFALEDSSIGFSKLHMLRGHLLFDDDHEHFAKLTVKDGVCYWKRALAFGETEHGMLRLYGNGFYGEGVVVRNGVSSKFYTAHTNIYDMKLTQKDGAQLDCGTYEMGYRMDGGRLICVGDWKMPYTDINGNQVTGSAASSDQSDISYYIDKQHNLACSVRFRKLAMRQYDVLRTSGMQNSELIFDTVFAHISGSACMVDEKGSKTEAGMLSGELNPQTTEKIFTLTNRLAECQMSDGLPDACVSAQEMETLSGLLNRSVLDLYNLSQPENMGDVHSECFDKLIKMTAHAAYKNNDEMREFIGIAAPTVDDVTGDLTQAQAKIAEDNKDFFIDGLGLAYLSYSYSKSTDEKISGCITSIPDYEKKIKYYMQGKDQGCMCTTSGYQTAANSLYKMVYAANVPGLSEYIAEQKEADWAKQLYEYCVAPEILNGLILTNMVDPDNARLNHLCTVLDTLDDTERVEIDQQAEEGTENKKYSFGAALRKQVTDLTFKYAFRNIKLPDKDDADSVSAFNATLAAFLETYFKNLNSHAFTNWTQEIYQEAEQDLAEAAEAAGYASKEAYINDITNVVADTTSALLSLNNPDMPSCIVDFFSAHTGVSRCITMAFYTTGIATLCFGFTRWSELDDKERALLIGNTVAIGMTALNDISVWRACSVFKQAWGDLSGADSAITAACTEADFTKAFSASGDIETALTKLGVDAGQVTSAEGDIMASASKWMKVCQITNVAAKVSSVLLMAAALGFQIFETVRDFNSGQPAGIEAMDVIQDISCGIGFLAEAGGGIAALCGMEVCSAIPVVGIICAVVGIIAAVVMIFIKRKEPPTPVEVFIQSRCVPFVQNALMPPKEWIDAQKKIDGHLCAN